MAKQPKRKRIKVTIKQKQNRQRGIDNKPPKRAISPDRIDAVFENDGAVLIRNETIGDDIVVNETIDDLVSQSDGALIKLTPVCFECSHNDDDHVRRGSKMAVNVDLLTILPTKDKRGTVVSIDGVDRDIVVRETADEIEALIDGD